MKKVEVGFVFYDGEDSSAVIDATSEMLNLGARGFKYFYELEHPQISTLMFTKEPLSESEIEVINEIEVDEAGAISDINTNGGEYEIESIGIVLFG